MDAAAEERVARRDAGVDDLLGANAADRPLQPDVEPVRGQGKTPQKLRPHDDADGPCSRDLGIQSAIAAADRIIALARIRLPLDQSVLIGGYAGCRTLLLRGGR